MKKTYGENRQAKTSKQQRMKDANDGLFYLGYLSTFRKKVQSSELDGAEQSSTTPCLKLSTNNPHRYIPFSRALGRSASKTGVMV